MTRAKHTDKRVITPELINDFRCMLTEDEKSPSTIAQYVNGIERFAYFADGKDVTKTVSIKFKQKLVNSGCYAVRTVNTILAAVNSFFKHMGWYDCIVKTLKIQHDAFRAAERELTKADYQKLLRAAKEMGRERICLVMQTICATGIRVSELKFITVEAVHKGYAEVNLKGKARRVLIPKDLKRVLKEYIKKTGRQSGSVFVTRGGKPLDRSNICHEMKQLCEKAGIEKSKVFPHNLRHLFACVYCEQDKNINNLADLLGHANVNTTRIYTQVSMDRLLQRVNKMGLAGFPPWNTEKENKQKEKAA